MMSACLVLSVLCAQGAEPDPVRRAVERSLPFIEKGGVDWMKNRKCSSCHHVTFMVWSHREAQARGFAVDAKKLEEWTTWAMDFSLTTKTKEGKRNGGGLDTMAQVILARPAKADEAPYRELAGMILSEQKPAGYWEAGGQLPSQRRAKEETHDASTMWVVHSLRSLGQEEGREKPFDSGPAALAQGKAMSWLKEKKPGPSAESLALHLLTTPSDPLLKELLSRQNEDGGWSWLKGEASDALATGQVLYVLGFSDAKAVAGPVRRARDFLAKTQLEDGSWKVPSTKPDSKDPSIAVYWGTAWAALGLLRTLP